MMRRPFLLRAVSVAVSFAVTIAIVPRALCGHPAQPLFDGELAAQDALAREVAREIAAAPERHFYRSGIRALRRSVGDRHLPDGDPGPGADHPRAPRTPRRIPARDARGGRAPDRPAHAADGDARPGATTASTTMAPGEGHAYLGYINLALGMLRAVDPATPYAALHDRLTAALAERLDRVAHRPDRDLPGRDLAARRRGGRRLDRAARGGDRHRSPRAARDAGRRAFRGLRAPQLGLSRAAREERHLQARRRAPRFGHGDRVVLHRRSPTRALSRRLFDGLRTDGRICALGFCGIREYARGFHGKGDGNAGPMLMGVSVGATGFALGAARAHGDRDLYRELYRSAHLAGVPVGVAGGTKFAAGGALGQRAAARDADREPRRAAGGRRRRRTGRRPMIRRVWTLAIAIAAAAVVHAIAGHRLAAVDPIAGWSQAAMRLSSSPPSRRPSRACSCSSSRPAGRPTSSGARWPPRRLRAAEVAADHRLQTERGRLERVARRAIRIVLGDEIRPQVRASADEEVRRGLEHHRNGRR